MRRALLLLALVAAGPATAAEPAGNWRRIVSEHDRQRLRDWRTAWIDALGQARGKAASAIAADPVLFDPDAALTGRALPPPGDYRCRHVGVGGAAALAEGPWQRCRLDGTEAPLRLTDLDGVQRHAGLVYADGERRAVFLGTTMFAEEHRPAPYGRAAGRDLAGAVERIGERRWRLVLPYPRFGATLELIELVPVA